MPLTPKGEPDFEIFEKMPPSRMDRIKNFEIKKPKWV
jgi:hypothetical protein